MDARDNSELLWAAGFFDGEGSISLSGHRWLQLSAKQVDPRPLHRLHAALGYGRVGGPYGDRPGRAGYSPSRQPSYMWYATCRQAEPALSLLLPYLTEPKLGQAERALQFDHELFPPSLSA